MWCGERWRERIEAPDSSEILVGSELEDPDLLPGELPLHGMVWRLMAHGGELSATHHGWITARGGGIAFRPSITLGRSAAVAGVRALYIMRGEGPRQRRIRALQLLNDEAGAVRGFASMIPEGAETLELDPAEFAKEYGEDISAELVALGKSADSKKTDTALMTEAAPAFLENEHKARDMLENYWRTASAVVHARACMWDLGVLDESPEAQLAKAWGAPTQVLELAWDTWNRMRGADEEGRLARGVKRALRS